MTYFFQSYCQTTFKNKEIFKGAKIKFSPTRPAVILFQLNNISINPNYCFLKLLSILRRRRLHRQFSVKNIFVTLPACICSFKYGHITASFCVFSSLLHRNSNINLKSIDVVFGIWTKGQWTVGADESTELCVCLFDPTLFNIFVLSIFIFECLSKITFNFTLIFDFLSAIPKILVYTFVLDKKDLKGSNTSFWFF